VFVLPVDYVPQTEEFGSMVETLGLLTSTNAADRMAYARDLWPRHHLAVRAGNKLTEPRTIVWPRSTDEVVKLVRWAHERCVPLVPFGAGSGVCAAVLPHAEAIVVDMKRMSAWRHLDPSAPTLDVEAGHMGVPLEERLNRQRLTLGHFPSSILCSTVGGWVAARSAGQASGYYGKIEDMVVALECVTGTGDVLTLHHRAAGPSLVPIVVGSEGTLAIVTSATLRLHPLPDTRAFAAWSFPSTRAGWEAMREMFQRGLRPAIARLYDPFDAMLAKQGSVKKKGVVPSTPGTGSSVLRTILRRPGAFNTLLESRAFANAVGGAMLVVIFEGEAATSGVHVASDIAMRMGAVDEGEAPARKWLEHRYSVSYRQSPAVASGLFVDTMEVAAPWSRLEALYEGVLAAVGPHVFIMAHFSHAYADGCCIYFSFAGSASAPGVTWDDACEKTYDRTWRAALDAVVAAGGTIAHHHGVGRSKAPRMTAELGSSGVEVVHALKRAFDPKGILNPGVLVPPIEPFPYPEPWS
jgi:alkyldihydroxyacetonephosphate synthase